MPPKQILIASTDEEKDKQIANLKAELDEEKTTAKKANEEYEKMEASLKAITDEDKMESAKKAIKAALDEEEDETKKAKIASVMKAMSVFETGNGVNTNANETEKEKEQTAVIASLTAKAALPIITKMLTARKIAGADEKALDEERTRLSALTYPALEAEFKTQEIFINSSLSARHIEDNQTELTAALEKEFEFNGETGSLVGKTFDLDEALEAAPIQ